MNPSYYRRFYLKYKASSFAKHFKRKRYNFTDYLLGGLLSQHDRSLKVLEIGCGYGSDFLQMAAENDCLELYGLDPVKKDFFETRFNFIKGFASEIDFPDGFFDVVVSYGVLEHIQPIEELAKSIKEIRRVGKVYCILVPSVNTVFEPHTRSIFWQLRDHNRKSTRKPIHEQLNYFSDEAWLQFEGFAGAKTARYRYMPFITNLFIYNRVHHDLNHRSP